MAEIKIYGGTAKGEQSLCDTCKFSQVRQGYAESQKVVICGLMRQSRDPFVHWPVASCGDYPANGIVHKDDLEKIALLIDGTHIKHEGFGGGRK